MNRNYRLTSSSDFQRVRREGKSYAHPLAILVVSPNGLKESRFGVTAGRAVGNAVLRNRAKRRLRAALQEHMTNVKPGWDIILIARSQLPQAKWQEIRETLATLLRRADLLGQVK
jgi:ribonuclease P protein component